MFIEKLAPFWRVDDALPQNADLIALVSFGATEDGLTRGSETTLKMAKKLAGLYPKAQVAFGAFTLSRRRGLEEKVKKESFENAIFAGQVISTIEEAEKIRAALPAGFGPRNIVVVTDEWHSRSAKTVWRSIWKDAASRPDIRIVTVQSSRTIDPMSPMRWGRKHWTWMLVNVLRQLFLVCVPGSINVMKKLNLHQPS